MPFKDPAKEREWRMKYRAEHPEQRKQTQERYRATHREKIRAYCREYNQRPEVIQRRKEYYLEHREEHLLNSKRNRLMKQYEQEAVPKWKHRKSSRDCARRKRLGIEIQRTQSGYFWKSGKISNGPFNYLREALKDAEKAFA